MVLALVAGDGGGGMIGLRTGWGPRPGVQVVCAPLSSVLFSLGDGLQLAVPAGEAWLSAIYSCV